MESTIVILGATGDLTKKKLIPAIYRFLIDKKLDNFAIVGMARDDTTGAAILKEARRYIKKPDAKAMKMLETRFHYFKGDFLDEKRFSQLGGFISSVEKKYKLGGNRLFYLATLPIFFDAISSNLAKYKIAPHTSKRWSRVVYEKPFGEDLKSAKKINRCLGKVFKEEQVYRIDHYLGKELVQNISTLRFTNAILRPLWNWKGIDHVQILITEDFGVEGRGAFYDRYGAIKDVMQNHFLQLLSLITMEAPKRLIGDKLRDEKVKVLRSVKRIKGKDVILGQYDGYDKVGGVKKGSTTETFIAGKLEVNNKRWKGVPFYFMLGKHLPKRSARIYMQFTNPPCGMFGGVCEFPPNSLTIQIQPDEGFKLQFNAKVPGRQDTTAVNMDFCHSCVFGPNTPEAYENVILDVVRGDQSVFVRSDEIEAEWKIIDDLKKSLIGVKPVRYKKNKLPKEAEIFMKKERRTWALE